MPVPKRKVSKSRRDKRQSTKFIRPQAFTECSNCQSALNTHQACLHCGFYKGKKVMVGKLDKNAKKADKLKARKAQEQQEEPKSSPEVQKISEGESKDDSLKK